MSGRLTPFEAITRHGRDDSPRAWIALGNTVLILPELLETFDAVITDPPYSSGGMMRADRTDRRTSQKYAHTEYQHLHDDFSGDNKDQWAHYKWSVLWLSQVYQRLVDNGLLVVFSDWRQLAPLIEAVQAANFIYRGIVVWDKTESARPMQGRYRAQAEFMVWATKGAVREQSYCAPGVFRLPVNSEPKEHQTAKPVALMEQVMTLAGRRVLDPFMGSGTTGVAAVRMGRDFWGIDLNAAVFEKGRDRIQRELAQGELFATEQERF